MIFFFFCLLFLIYVFCVHILSFFLFMCVMSILRRKLCGNWVFLWERGGNINNRIMDFEMFSSVWVWGMGINLMKFSLVNKKTFWYLIGFLILVNGMTFVMKFKLLFYVYFCSSFNSAFKLFTIFYDICNFNQFLKASYEIFVSIKNIKLVYCWEIQTLTDIILTKR